MTIRNLPYRRPYCQILGQAFGYVLAVAEETAELADAIDDDLRAFHAPSECYPLAMRGINRRIIEAIDIAVAMTGMSWDRIVAEVKERTGGRWLAWTLHNSMIPDAAEDRKERINR